MPAPVYKNIPDLEQWKKDSSATLSARDQILKRIDELIPVYFSQPDDFYQVYVLCDLYFTTNYWLKLATEKRSVNTSREPAVFALFKVVVEKLCESYKVTVNLLPNILESSFGRELGTHGQSLDKDRGLAQYLTRAEAKKHQIYFKNGLAYHFHKGSLVLAESQRCRPNPPDMMGPEYAGFAMSMSRDLYMAAHLCTNQSSRKKANFYHSSYLAGQTVLCTGTIRIRAGIITDLKDDSGHYQPTLDHMVNVLAALRMFGVNLRRIMVHTRVGADNVGFKNRDWVFGATDGETLLRDRGNTHRMERGVQQYTAHKAMRPVGVTPR